MSGASTPRARWRASTRAPRWPRSARSPTAPTAARCTRRRSRSPSGRSSRRSPRGGPMQRRARKEADKSARRRAILDAWLDEVERRLGDPRGAWDAERVADALSRSLEGREALTRLITVVGGVLEHNIGDDRARRFKRALHARVTRGGALLA